MRLQHLLEVHRWIIKESIGSFEFGPLWKGLRQGPARSDGKVGGDFHKASIKTWLAQVGKCKLLLGPLTSRLQSGCTHKPTGEEPKGCADARRS
jgi:hypothetical protein